MEKREYKKKCICKSIYAVEALTKNDAIDNKTHTITFFHMFKGFTIDAI